MIKSKAIHHYWILGAIILVGAVIRFAYLESKPLGIDEVITAIFSLGKSYEAVPTNQVVSLESLAQLLHIQPQTSCSIIVTNLSRQSTHPPLFFCLMHQWLTHIGWLNLSLVWKLRAFSAVWGVLAIAAVYYFNRIAVSTGAGLMAAAIMAVSPFGVYLSQEARHYTLPTVVIILALILCWQIIETFRVQQLKWHIWIAWGLTNSVAFYLHYFCFISFVAQFLTLIIFAYIYRIKRQLWSGFICALIPLILLLPWWSILAAHSTSPKTSWLPAPQNWLAPLYQLLIGWLLMVVYFPIESQPLSVQIISGLSMLSVGIWLVFYVKKQYKSLNYYQQQPIIFLSCYVLIILMVFSLLTYGLNKDITAIPRYNFIYYPAVILALAIVLSNQSKFNNYVYNFVYIKWFKLKKYNSRNLKNKFFTRFDNQLSIIFSNYWSNILLLSIGIVSSCLIVLNLSFKKPYLPEFAADNFNQSSAPLAVVVGYKDTTHLSLGISYALALKKIRSSSQTSKIIFLDRSLGYDLFWQQLSKMPVFPTNIWIVAPGLKRRAYPEKINLIDRSCVRNPEQYYRIGIPHQLYQCGTTNFEL